MKAVLLSIKPKYCELIASGEKTVEIRKNRPKIDVPFKCYIYCTKGGRPLVWGSPVEGYVPENLVQTYGYSKEDAERIFGCWNGKVIGEFVCDEITFLGNITTDEWKYLVGDKHEYHKKIVVENACLSEAEVLKYGNGKSCDAWHISDLVIYDEPKELSEFYRKCDGGCENDCEHWRYIRVNAQEFDMDCDCFELLQLTRPPQSWCYVEKLEG